MRHHRSVAYSVELVLQNKHQIYGGAPKVNWYLLPAYVYIDYIYKKIIKFTSIFYKIRDYIPDEVKKMVYFAFIHSNLNYGIEIYANIIIHI